MGECQTTEAAADHTIDGPVGGLWKVADVAAYARCSPRTVGNLMVAGMPFIKLGTLVRFEPGAVIAWMRGERR